MTTVKLENKIEKEIEFLGSLKKGKLIKKRKKKVNNKEKKSFL